MRFSEFGQFFSVDSTNLTIKGKLLAIIAGGIAIYLVAYITRQYSLGAAYPIIVSSIGASAALLFIVPHSPLAQPWPLIGGQLVSAFVGMACAIHIPDAPLACGCAVSFSFLAMLLLRCLHPPGASTALAPIMGGAPLIAIGYDFVWQPVGINVLVILAMTLILSRFLLRVPYPVMPQLKTTPPQKLISADIEHALKAMNTFIDVTQEDLSQLVQLAEQYRFARIQCKDIMQREVISVTATMRIEKAWQLMYGQQLKALPVLDNNGSVIGIITWADFFKVLNTPSYKNFIQKFLGFFKRRGFKKAKLVSDIMTKSVQTMNEQSSLTQLMALMSIKEHRQIPIINDAQQLVGIIYQGQLITALYKI